MGIHQLKGIEMIKTMTIGDFSRSEPGTVAVWIFSDISKTIPLQRDITSRLSKKGKKCKQSAYHGFSSRENEPVYFLMAEML